MDNYYLVDFENVHNEGICNIENITKSDHVYIFSTEKAKNIRNDIVWMNGDIEAHLVMKGDESLDKHLLSYLGYLLGVNGKDCNYVIISNDKGYNNIISFWKNEGYQHISRRGTLLENVPSQKKPSQTVNSNINAGMTYSFNGDDRSELNIYMQRGLSKLGYARNIANQICKFVIAHCNDERMLCGIHNDLKNTYNDYSKVYDDVKGILEKFARSKSKIAKRESQVRSFWGQNFKNKYAGYKEDIIEIILKAETKQQVNNGLMKICSDGAVVSDIYKKIYPLINDLPGK